MSTRELFALQALDLEADAEKEAVTAIQARLGPSEAMAAAQAEQEDARGRLSSGEKRLRDAEWRLQDLEAKISALEKKLYGGSVRNPKELSGLEAEVKQLQEQRRAADDQALLLMEEIDSLKNLVVSQSEKIRVLETEWRREQAALQQEQDQRLSRLSELESQRKTAAPQIPPASLSLYEFLRPRKGGRAVARVEGGTCSGCRISLPMKDLQKARAGQEPVQCSSCERILFVS